MKKLQKFLKKRLVALLGLLVFVLGFGAGDQVSRYNHKVTGETYMTCAADPKVQLVGQIEYYVKGHGVPLDAVRKSIDKAPSPEDKKAALEAYDFYVKNQNKGHGVTVEAFAECLNK